jgi:hypothetical protein
MTLTVPRMTTSVRLDERWLLVALPIVKPLPIPPVGQLNSAEAVRSLYR